MENSDNKILLLEVIADSEIGGGPKHVLGILKYIDKSKFEPKLFCPPGFLTDECKQFGVQTIEFNPRSKFDVAAFFQLRKNFSNLLKNNCNDVIIHSHGPRAGLLARLAAPNEAKKVHTEHNWDKNYYLNNSLNYWLQKKFIGWQNKKSDLIIAVSSSVQDFLIRNKMVEEKKITIIPNGIEKKETETKKKVDVVIGTIGNLNNLKGQIYLIQAIKILEKSYPEAQLEIIGEGEERKNLENAIRENDLESKVKLLGRKNNIEQYLCSWRIFSLPSLSETFGISILEAMNSGLPVVASMVGGIPDIIKDKENGLLVPPKNSKAIAAAIEQILSNPETEAKLISASQKTAEQFQWKNIVPEIEKAFLSLL